MHKKTELLDTIVPGEILSEEFMKPMGLSINQLARDIDVSPGRISEIVNGKRTITADTALRLGKYFGVSPEIWLNLQTDYDLRIARRTTWLETESALEPERHNLFNLPREEVVDNQPKHYILNNINMLSRHK